MEQTRVYCLYPAEVSQTSQLLRENVDYGQKTVVKNTAPSQMMARHPDERQYRMTWHTPPFFLPAFLYPEVPRWHPFIASLRRM